MTAADGPVTRLDRVESAIGAECAGHPGARARADPASAGLEPIGHERCSRGKSAMTGFPVTKGGWETRESQFTGLPKKIKSSQ